MITSLRRSVQLAALLALLFVVPSVAFSQTLAAPTEVEATFSSSSGTTGTVNLTWRYVGSAINGFQVRWRAKDLTGGVFPDAWGDWYPASADRHTACPPETARADLGCNDRAHAITGIPLSLIVEVEIRAYTSSVNGPGARSGEVVVPHAATVLPAPASIVAEPFDGWVRVSWSWNTSPTDDFVLDLRRSDDGAAWGDWNPITDPASATSAPTAYNDTAALNGVDYRYQVRAVEWLSAELNEAEEVIVPARRGHEGPPSPTSNPVTPTGSGSLQPPTDLMVTSTRSGTMTVSWRPPVPPPFQYLVQWTERLEDPLTSDDWRRYCAIVQGTAGLPNLPPEEAEQLADVEVSLRTVIDIKLPTATQMQPAFGGSCAGHVAR